MFRPEPLDLVLIALAAILLFGANRLPEVARSIGSAIREFRNELTKDK
jgi:sec-independent protein translocase protein TatA